MFSRLPFFHGFPFKGLQPKTIFEASRFCSGFPFFWLHGDSRYPSLRVSNLKGLPKPTAAGHLPGALPAPGLQLREAGPGGDESGSRISLGEGGHPVFLFGEGAYPLGAFCLSGCY